MSILEDIFGKSVSPPKSKSLYPRLAEYEDDLYTEIEIIFHKGAGERYGFPHDIMNVYRPIDVSWKDGVFYKYFIEGDNLLFQENGEKYKSTKLFKIADIISIKKLYPGI